MKAKTIIGLAAAASSVSSTAVIVATATPSSAVTCPSSGITDWQLKRTEQLWLGGQSSTGQSAGVVNLYYSPSTRCVFGQVVADSAPKSGQPNRGEIWTRNTDGTNVVKRTWCNIPAGQRACTTNKIYDGGIQAAAFGEVWYGDPNGTGSYAFKGKTGWY